MFNDEDWHIFMEEYNYFKEPEPVKEFDENEMHDWLRECRRQEEDE